MMPNEYWGMSLDDLSEQMYEIRSDATGAHYAAFEGSKEEARAKLIAAFTELIDKQMYRANSYGSRWKEGDDE